MRVFVIAAHPDDEVLGCGATVSRLAKESNDIFVAILGEGITSRYLKREDANLNLVKSLKKKTEMVKNLLGAKEFFFSDFPDNRFDTVSLLDVVKKIERWIDRLKPDIIFTHSAHDLNIDHIITHRAVITATRPFKNCPVKEIYTFEISSSTEWAFGEFGSFKPSVFFNIENTIDLKINAMETYDSEVREFPHPRSKEAIRNLARSWGSVVGVEYAEAFETVRRVL
ncbi:MAG: PIG-L family deacetylase [Deltaproteobacteria bacterium]|nr:PIG-L family deacetylase [Deltaproteobacteria bacterium]